MDLILFEKYYGYWFDIWSGFRYLQSIISYVNFDNVGNLDRRRFLIGYIFTLSNYAISYKALYSLYYFIYYKERAYDSGKNNGVYLIVRFG